MDVSALDERYRDLQRYVGWTDDDAARIGSIGDALQPYLSGLVEDFYAEIERHPEARRVITGGEAQIARLKQTLVQWLTELLSGNYDLDYVIRRWRVGYRHVEIGLDQVYTNAALSRLRTGLHESLNALSNSGAIAEGETLAIGRSLDKLLDLDLAIIEDAYQSEFHRRQQQIEKLATIGQFAGGIAHELRNPLNVIKTSAYYLLNARQVSEQKLAEHLKRIENQVELADGVITALHSFAKLPAPVLRSVELGDWLRETLASVDLTEHIEVNTEIPSGLPQAAFDPEQTAIVLRNLLRNADDAMAQGGRLNVSARDEGEFLAVEVSDTGPGIAAENLARVMEPLFSTKARGIGLGLAMAKAITEKNGGRLSVASEPGHGATFTLHLRTAKASS